MARALKLLVFALCRAIGLFAVARRLTRDHLRILAYHGFATGDELRFQPKLFISGRTFSSRMELLRRRGFRVATLAEAVRTLRQGSAASDTIVITIDDGYSSTASVAAPILAGHGYPATVYVTTYHACKQTPVFDLVIGYMLWKTTQHHVSVEWPVDGNEQVVLKLDSDQARSDAGDLLIRLGRAARDEPERVTLCRRLGLACDVPYDDIVARGAFRLMTADELAQASAMGLSIGLHTHRHAFPSSDLERCRTELVDNALALRELGIEAVPHFCYPSGVYDLRQWPLLDEMRIESSTTCDTGLVRRGDPPHGLRRFLDGEMVSELEFEAELCGFAEILRRTLRVRRRAGAP